MQTDKPIKPPEEKESIKQESNPQRQKQWRQKKINELGKEEYDKQNRLKAKDSRKKLRQRLGKEEYDRRIRAIAKESRARKIQIFGKDKYNKILKERAQIHRKQITLKLGAQLFLSSNPNTALPKEEVLMGIGNTERLRLNRIKDKKRRDAFQAKGIANLGSDEYWRRQYAKRKKERVSNPEMDEARKARLRTPEKRAQYAEYYRRKRQKIGFRIGGSIRRRVTDSLLRMFSKSNGKGYRQGNSLEVFGCSIDHLMFHFEQLFVEGMSFSNYGNGLGEWNVDHILCVAYFRKELENGSPDEIKKIEKMLNHFTNLVPLWSYENRAKNDSFPAWVKNRGCCFWTDLHEQYYKLRNFSLYLDETIDEDIKRQIDDESHYAARMQR